MTMDWKAQLNETRGVLGDFRSTHPKAAKGFTAMHQGGMAEGAVDVKHKELIALGIGIVRQCIDCIGFHVEAAAKAGATRDEIAECVGVAIVMGGGPAYMYGAKALQAYDQLIGG